ncbi:epoxyqueuosine reductase QueH [Butyrivibrio sp. AE2032]|uniref:epoxyqueuosine reductase QueH n=1 Tax=Butyrivibrio sp. AE2032 TaxID=1458463 RepID=UPI0005516022|nr:epoxyqueuosine reductase QueH [Butyrivibrio sp. AE2032]
MNKRNYSKELDERINAFQKDGIYPKLLLHACCAPCSSYCLEFLRQYFDVTVFFFNPNITDGEEYRKRVIEEKRLIEEYNKQVELQDFVGMHSDERARKIEIIEGDYDPKVFYEAARGYETCKEGGERCRKCFELRLGETARVAKEKGFDYMTTTLTISPLKNAQVLNEVGEEAAAREGIAFLPSDFKKKEGYKRSIELSQKFGLYRQNFCGCSFSKNNI